MIKIKSVIAEVLRIPIAEVHDNTSMESNPLWDSLSHMEIVYGLEKSFGVEFNGDEIIQITSISKIEEIISQKFRGLS